VSRLCSFAWLLLFLCAIAAPIAANAIGVNVTGTWDLTVTTDSVPIALTSSSDHVSCKWAGLMTLTQTGMDFTGSMMLNLVTGPCPATLSGPVQGSLSGSGSGFLISFGLASGEFGEVSFKGTVSEDSQSGQGTWTNRESGTWSAQRIRTGAPTLSGGGLATLFGLLLLAGALSARRRAARTLTSG